MPAALGVNETRSHAGTWSHTGAEQDQLTELLVHAERRRHAKRHAPVRPRGLGDEPWDVAGRVLAG